MDRGVFTYPDGTTYEGEWKDNRRHGHGVWTRPDGTVYVGEWENDKPHGQGTLTWPTGKKFTGEWINGKRHGSGIEISPDGTKLYGEWEDGTLLEQKFASTTNEAHASELEETKQIFSNVPDGVLKQKSGINQRNNLVSSQLAEKHNPGYKPNKRHQRLQSRKKSLIMPVFLFLFILALGAILFIIMREDETSFISGFEPEAAKADFYYIERLIDCYQESLVYAINSNNFPLLSNLLYLDNDFYYAQKDLVEDHFGEGIKVEIEYYDIAKIAKGEEGNYQIYLVEKIRKDYPDRTSITDDNNWIITVVFDHESLLVRDKDKWVLGE
jgi:hypothetical protein